MTFDSISDTIDKALTSAGLDPHSGVLKDVTSTIRRTLTSAGLLQADAAHPVAQPAAARGGVEHAPPAGEFTAHVHEGPAGTRKYKLYVPTTPAKRPRPLVVMLHGCKQNPDDFAAGTRMNELAQARGFLVAYPAQSPNANGANCWNWFQPGDQQREAGEPAIIAGIVAEIAAAHAVDPERVFVAGLSAGASMAVILGQTYPDVFKAVGAHSGLPCGAAHDVASAFGAMHGGPAAAPGRGVAVPTIVFQGDRDTTVVTANADAIVEQVLGGATPGETVRHTARATAATHGYSSVVHTDERGQAMVEKWLVKGGAHTWFGGSPEGSYTDAKGPDASAEMIRFFLDR